MEEEEVLQNKWAYLSGNMVDSDQNIDNHLFPYILSQLSLEEFIFLDNVCNDKILRVEKWKFELEKFKAHRLIAESDINGQLLPLKQELENCLKSNDLSAQTYTSSHNLQSKIFQLERAVKTLESKEQVIVNRIKEAAFVSPESLREYQLSNMVRLGLVKVILRPYTNTHTLEIPNDPNKDYLIVDFDKEIESDLEEHTLTELGELFIKSCNEKS